MHVHGYYWRKSLLFSKVEEVWVYNQSYLCYIVPVGIVYKLMASWDAKAGRQAAW